jgi:hypothetical protein
VGLRRVNAPSLRSAGDHQSTVGRAHGITLDPSIRPEEADATRSLSSSRHGTPSGTFPPVGRRVRRVA